MCVCVRERERECVCERERERECVCERERVRERGLSERVCVQTYTTVDAQSYSLRIVLQLCVCVRERERERECVCVRERE